MNVDELRSRIDVVPGKPREQTDALRNAIVEWLVELAIESKSARTAEQGK